MVCFSSGGASGLSAIWSRYSIAMSSYPRARSPSRNARAGSAAVTGTVIIAANRIIGLVIA